VSRSAAEWGHASLVGFHFVGRPVSAGGVVRVASPRYATLTPNRPGEYPTTEASLFASASIGGPLSMTAQHTRTRLYQGITRDRSGLMATIHLARNLELTASASQTEDEHGRAREAYGGVTILFGRSSASVAHVRDARGNRMAVDAQRSLPVGEGYGYQLHAEGGETGIATGVARYQGRHGRYELRQESVAGRTSTTVSVMGSIVGIGGGLYASRPVQDSFALIRVPGVEGVRAYSSHQTVGKTNKSGDLLVPDLQAYYGNTLGIADSDVPIAYSVTSSGQIMAVPYRGGAVALFPVKKVQRVVGTVTLVEDGRERVPAYGEIVITIEGAEIASPVGGSGAFYFEDLPGGTHAARVRDGGGHDCTFQMTVPASDDLVVDLGNLRCEVRRP
jgi:outer membrane usher protein